MSDVTALEALRRLLDDYDRDNRLRIDAVYAQFSPTLDEYYAEELRVEFPNLLLSGDSGDGIRPELTLTRTVPGSEPRSVSGAGAPFPLARARTLVGRAAADTPEGAALVDGIHGGLVWLQARQVGRSQVVQLVLQPAGDDVLDVLIDL